jgi:ATP-binding cassette subfamily B protein
VSTAARGGGAPARADLAFHEEASLGRAYDGRLVRRFLPFLAPHARLFVTSLLLLVPVAALSVVQPLLLKHAVDRGFAPGGESVLAAVAAGFLVVLLVEGAVRFGHAVLLALGGQRSTAGFRGHVFRHIQSLSLGYFDRTPIGRILTRATSDVENVNEAFSMGLTAVGDVVSLVAILVMMLVLDAELALVMLATLPPLVLVIEAFRRRARVAFREIRAKIARINATLSEQVQGIAVVQAFGREERCASEFDEVNASFRDANRRAIRYDVGIYAFVDAFGDVVVAGVLLYAAYSLADDPPSAGVMIAFLELVRRFFMPVRELSNKYTVLQSAMASLERIFELLDVSEVERPTGGVVAEVPPAAVPREEPARPDEAIAFEHVDFAYARGEQVLHDLSITVRRGEKVALVGATGAGKTTVLQLVQRLYEPQKGTVRIGGVDARAQEHGALRRRFAVVAQDVFLFAGDVAANVAVGEERADEARVERALAQVGALPLVRARGGLGAKVDERGANFSAGERQLFAFARALYRDPEILILDEATASVDTETEALLQRAVEKVLEGRTALVVAHRLSTIRNADRIVVLHRGRVVEQGTHAELLAREGVYAKLHALQFA